MELKNLQKWLVVLVALSILSSVGLVIAAYVASHNIAGFLTIPAPSPPPPPTAGIRVYNSTTDPVTSINFGSVDKGRSASWQGVVKNNGAVDFTDIDIWTDLPSETGTITWQRWDGVAWVDLESADYPLAKDASVTIKITATVSSTAASGSITFNIVVYGEK